MTKLVIKQSTCALIFFNENNYSVFSTGAASARQTFNEVMKNFLNCLKIVMFLKNCGMVKNRLGRCTAQLLISHTKPSSYCEITRGH